MSTTCCNPIVDVAKLEEQIKENTAAIASNTTAIEANAAAIKANAAATANLEAKQVKDIRLNVNTETWQLVLGDGSTVPFRKVDKDTQNNILEEED